MGIICCRATIRSNISNKIRQISNIQIGPLTNVGGKRNLISLQSVSFAQSDQLTAEIKIFTHFKVLWNDLLQVLTSKKKTICQLAIFGLHETCCDSAAKMSPSATSCPNSASLKSLLLGKITNELQTIKPSYMEYLICNMKRGRGQMKSWIHRI